MKKQVKPVSRWQDPTFVYIPSVATDILKTLKRFGFVPPSEKKEPKHG